MPMAFAAAAAAIQAGAGVSSAIGSFVGTIAGSVNVGFAVASAVTFVAPLVLSAGVTAALTPPIPNLEAFATPIRQPLTSRRTGYGRCRLSGPAMLWEAKAGLIYDVYALHDGRVEAIEQLRLHDDVVTLNGSHQVLQGADGRYQGLRTRIFTRLGADTETSYTADADFSALGAGVWTSAHRGDGIASLCMIAKAVEQADMPVTYPNNQPQPSVVARLSPVFDWRDVGQDLGDPDTWTASFNPIVQLVDYLTHPVHGMGFDWARRITPGLDITTAAADVCDEAVSLKAGGTEPRYEACGVFERATAPTDVIGRLLGACDGWMSQRGDGSFIIRAGKYEEPEVTFSSEEGHITGLSFQPYVEDEQAVNVLVVSFTSPDHEFNEVETDPWRDEDDILSRGVERAQNLSLPWVPRNGQARRLAKRNMARLAAPVRGTVRTNLYGLRGLGERYIRLQIPEVETLADLVVEVQSVEIDLLNLSLTWAWVSADPNVDAWSPATEEGDGPATEGRVAPEILTAPTIDTAVAFFDGVGVGGDGVRVRIEVTDVPGREDLTWFARWRVDGAVSWNESQYSDLDPGADVVLETSFVTSNATVEVEVTYGIGGGDVAPWSTPETVDTSTAGIAPGPASAVTAAGGAGAATIGWRMPNSANLASAKVWRDTDSSFAGAVAASGDLAGGLGATMSFNDTGLSPGTYYYWVQTKSSAGVTAAPVASTPASVTVT